MITEDRNKIHESPFNDYSPRNAMLLLMSGATAVAGYRSWQANGRQVRKGEHGIHIVAPVTRKSDDGSTTMVNIRSATVFDISQTDPIQVSAEVSA